MRTRHARGNALAETVIALAALLPFIGGIVLLGKQLDVKHKTLDALRYSVWERTVWSGSGANSKSAADISTEALDRTFGDPSAGVSSLELLHSTGVSRNPLWGHHGESLLSAPHGAFSSRLTYGAPPVQPGHVLMPGLAHGSGPIGAVASALQMDELGLNRNSFATAAVETNIRAFLDDRAGAAPLSQRATGAVLSDTWSPRDEGEFGRRVDGIIANELIETLELPGRPVALQALGKGGPLYGEGQYGWEPQLRLRSSALPSAYVVERERE